MACFGRERNPTVDAARRGRRGFAHELLSRVRIAGGAARGARPSTRTRRPRAHPRGRIDAGRRARPAAPSRWTTWQPRQRCLGRLSTACSRARPPFSRASCTRYSPLDPVTELLSRAWTSRPRSLMPEIARTVYRTFYGAGESRVGVLRALFFEISSPSPDTAEGTQDAIRGLVGSRCLLCDDPDARWPPSPDALRCWRSSRSSVRSSFHLLTRPLAERMLGLDIDGEAGGDSAGRDTGCGPWRRRRRPHERLVGS